MTIIQFIGTTIVSNGQEYLIPPAVAVGCVFAFLLRKATDQKRAR